MNNPFVFIIRLLQGQKDRRLYHHRLARAFDESKSALIYGMLKIQCHMPSEALKATPAYHDFNMSSSCYQRSKQISVKEDPDELVNTLREGRTHLHMALEKLGLFDYVEELNARYPGFGDNRVHVTVVPDPDDGDVQRLLPAPPR